MKGVRAGSPLGGDWEDGFVKVEMEVETDMRTSPFSFTFSSSWSRVRYEVPESREREAYAVRRIPLRKSGLASAFLMLAQHACDATLLML